MKYSLNILTIILGAILALILTRMGISYLLILIALGVILPFITENKSGAVISGILYATISYILSYPSGLFLINYMPSITIPINVSPLEVTLNLLIGLLVPVIIATIICYIFALIGTYLSKLCRKYYSNKQEEEHHFEDNHIINEVSNDKKHFKQKTSQKLDELSPIQRAKTRKKFKRE